MASIIGLRLVYPQPAADTVSVDLLLPPEEIFVYQTLKSIVDLIMGKRLSEVTNIICKLGLALGSIKIR